MVIPELMYGSEKWEEENKIEILNEWNKLLIQNSNSEYCWNFNTFAAKVNFSWPIKPCIKFPVMSYIDLNILLFYIYNCTKYITSTKDICSTAISAILRRKWIQYCIFSAVLSIHHTLKVYPRVCWKFQIFLSNAFHTIILYR